MPDKDMKYAGLKESKQMENIVSMNLYLTVVMHINKVLEFTCSSRRNNTITRFSYETITTTTLYKQKLRVCDL
jgi:hypothetical protein